jgi:hypothetical protein
MPQSQSSGRYDQQPEYHGRFAVIDAPPRPFQQPIPLVAGPQRAGVSPGGRARSRLEGLGGRA